MTSTTYRSTLETPSGPLAVPVRHVGIVKSDRPEARAARPATIATAKNPDVQEFTFPALSDFVPSRYDLEAQAFDPDTFDDEDLADSSLFVLLAAAIKQARYTPRQRAALATTIRNAASGMDGYKLLPNGQMRYEVEGGRAPYVYDDATESCTCPLWEQLRVCKHSIDGARRLAEARRLVGDTGSRQVCLRDGVEVAK